MPISLDRALPARTAALAFLAVVLVAVAPLFFAEYPPLHDYPFHLARIFILESWSRSPALQSWYHIGSFLLPNVGMDLIALLLAKLVPVETAGRIFVALTLGIMMSGCMALHRSLHGRFSMWPLVSSLFLFNWIFLFGFLNYLLGVGLMLWAAAIWVALSRSARWLRLVCGTALSVALFFCHFVALGLFAVIVAGYELQRAAGTLRADGEARVRTALGDLLAGAAIFIVPAILFLVSPTAGEAGSVILYSQPWLLWKPFTAWRSLMAGNWALDIVLTVAIAVGLPVVLLRGRLRMARSMSLALALLVAIYLVMPMQVFSGYYVDTRLPVAILFFAIGCTCPVLRSEALNRAVVAVLAALLVFRSAVLSFDWHDHDRVVREFTTAFATLPAGSVLFAATEGQVPGIGDLDLRLWRPPLKHVVSLATLQRPVFVPATWAHPSQQPITVADGYAGMYRFQDQNPIRVESAGELAALAGQIRELAAALPEGSGARIFLLVLDPRSATPEGPPETAVVASGSRFVLLEVKMTAAGHRTGEGETS